MSQESSTKLITYKDLLAKLKDSSDKNHLLLGNGFNNSLGIPTTYEAIFQEMTAIYSPYHNIETMLKNEYNYNLELLLKTLEDNELADNKKDLGSVLYSFLTGSGTHKIKLDFMKATLNIANRGVKDIYKDEANKEKDMRLFLKNFSKYFTLNYDPLFYLLLMKLKDGQQEPLNAIQKTLRIEIEHAHKVGELVMRIGKNQIELKATNKDLFTKAVKHYFSNKWRVADIKKVTTHILKAEKGLSDTEGFEIPNDGFGQDGKEVIPSEPQQILFTSPREEDRRNLYFLHGAFHLIQTQVRKTPCTRKIIKKGTTSFLKRLEDIIYTGKEDTILWVLAGNTEYKKKKIDDRHYLKKCFGALKDLKGRLVILGSSLAENDKHIFDAINNNDGITHVYVSTSEDKDEMKKTMLRAEKVFPDKEHIEYFDYSDMPYSKVQVK